MDVPALAGIDVSGLASASAESSVVMNHYLNLQGEIYEFAHNLKENVI